MSYIGTFDRYVLGCICSTGTSGNGLPTIVLCTVKLPTEIFRFRIVAFVLKITIQFSADCF